MLLCYVNNQRGWTSPALPPFFVKKKTLHCVTLSFHASPHPTPNMNISQLYKERCFFQLSTMLLENDRKRQIGHSAHDGSESILEADNFNGESLGVVARGLVSGRGEIGRGKVSGAGVRV